MRTFWTTTAVSVALSVGAGAASAATWDFAGDAEKFFNENEYEGSFDQVYGDNQDAIDAETSGLNTQDGITVDASVIIHPPDQATDPHGFMDSRGNNDGDDLAGLGVCSSGFIDGGTNDGLSECSSNVGSNTGDDNLVFTEILELSFGDTAVQLTELFVRNAGHDPFSADHGIIIMTEVTKSHPEDVNYFEVKDGFVQGLDSLGFSNVFYFTSAFKCDYEAYEISDDGYDDDEYDDDEPKCTTGPEIYLSSLTASEIPLPAAGWLLLGGVGGLAAMKRRRKS